ncbi:hypothetical protein KCU98_g45, partial [Aureobasidium melanogenum]
MVSRRSLTRTAALPLGEVGLLFKDEVCETTPDGSRRERRVVPILLDSCIKCHYFMHQAGIRARSEPRKLARSCVLGLVQTIGRTISGKVVVETKLERPDHNFEGEQNSRPGGTEIPCFGQPILVKFSRHGR